MNLGFSHLQDGDATHLLPQTCRAAEPVMAGKTRERPRV